MVPDLLRVGRGEAAEWGCALAQSYGYGRLLPERAAAHVGRLVCAASAALVSRDDGGAHPRAGACYCLACISAATVALDLLLHCHSVAGGRDFDRELHIPQLPRADRKSVV